MLDQQLAISRFSYIFVPQSSALIHSGQSVPYSSTSIRSNQHVLYSSTTIYSNQCVLYSSATVHSSQFKHQKNYFNYQVGFSSNPLDAYPTFRFINLILKPQPYPISMLESSKFIAYNIQALSSNIPKATIVKFTIRLLEPQHQLSREIMFPQRYPLYILGS